MEHPTEYDYDPADPVPTLGGTCTNDTLTEGTGSFDQRRIQSRSDVLVFTSDPLSEHTAVIGRVKVNLWASSSGRDTDFIAKLVDVYPDGRSYLMAEGMLRLRYRDSFTKPQPLTPQKVCEVTVRCWATSIVLNKGL